MAQRPQSGAHFDAGPEPSPASARLVADGANGIATGKGVHDRSQRDGKALIAARKEELFRWRTAEKALRR